MTAALMYIVAVNEHFCL